MMQRRIDDLNSFASSFDDKDSEMLSVVGFNLDGFPYLTSYSPKRSFLEYEPNDLYVSQFLTPTSSIG